MVKTMFKSYPLPMLKQTWDDLLAVGELDMPWLVAKNEEKAMALPEPNPEILIDLSKKRPILQVSSLRVLRYWILNCIRNP